MATLLVAFFDLISNLILHNFFQLNALSLLVASLKHMAQLGATARPQALQWLYKPDRRVKSDQVSKQV